MRMSVTPQEIAQHLVEELGHQEALEAYRTHLSRCYDPETAGVWTNIGQALESLNPTE
ncbi:hypothetical protein [Terasakiella pusilla]|uniref:hypothetical protein n=2 Tax=Terasakiella pusilla TaxID=64973 RepID=UPI0012EC708A|nr:hypothetical protein [Terasakiella pusilla]